MVLLKYYKNNTNAVNTVGYLHNAIKNTALNYKRDLKRHLYLELGDMDGEAPGELQGQSVYRNIRALSVPPDQYTHVQYGDVLKVIKSLKPKQKRALTSFILIGSTAETARAIGSNIESTKTNLRQARLKIKDIL
jgi:DNA-directed RNA polymerase specialized sigma24 family protein